MGRPRKGGMRESNGRTRRRTRKERLGGPDRGTEEIIERRRLMVGGFPDPSEPRRNCDPADKMAGYPLGILYLRGEITRSEYLAGLSYTKLHRAVFGTGSVGSCLASLQFNKPDEDGAPDEAEDATDPDERLAATEALLDEATAALRALPTRRPYSVLCNLALYDHPMRFMDTSRRRTPAATQADTRDLYALRLALGTLADMRNQGFRQPPRAYSTREAPPWKS